MVVQGFNKSQENVLRELEKLISEYFLAKQKTGILETIKFSRKKSAIDSRLRFLSKFYKK